MPNSPDYKITKLEKGPLQRFKNQNLIIKKFGEVGLQVYKAITGKRTSKELKKDLGIDEKLFDQIISFMHDTSMIEMEPIAGKVESQADMKEIEIEEPEEPETPARKLEDIPPEEQEEIEPEVPPLEEEPKPLQDKKESEDEIKPISLEDYEDKQEEEQKTEPEEEPKDKEEKEPEIEEEKIEPEKPEDEITITAFEEEPEKPAKPELSPVEKIISDKYGDVGIRVYALIDGQRTAEEIMRETGLTEPKLVEILDFMDEQGIIKLDYPKGGSSSTTKAKSPFVSASSTTAQIKSPTQPAAQEPGQGFKPIYDVNPDEAQAISSPVEIPIKGPLDIIKSVQVKTKVLLKYGDRGSRILEKLDGKNDVIDITLMLNIPLYEVMDILRYMLENGMLIIKAVSRADIRKKYGEDGYSVYKVYGKEGLLLYELIGKDLTIKQMADKITKDKLKVIDMFIFIHRVLGIELPIDKEVLAKQLQI